LSALGITFLNEVIPLHEGDLSGIAKRVVRNSLAVKEDDMVWIDTWHHTIELASEMALECRKLGAVPLITLDTDELYERTLKEVPAKFLRKTPKHQLKALDEVTVSIALAGPENPEMFHSVDTNRLAAIREAYRPIEKRILDSSIRGAFVTLGLITPERASVYGFSIENWRRAVNDAIDVDYDLMSQLGKRIADILAQAKEVRISSESGTDLRFQMAGRKVHIEDGVVDKGDIASGRPFTNLPTGYVTVAPQETSAEGTVLFDCPQASLGKMIEDLEWTFAEGKLKSFEAKRNVDAFSSLLDPGTGAKDRIARFSIGINPKAKVIGYFDDQTVLGAASIGIGDNLSLGGDNDSTFDFAGTILEPTIEVDGRVILDKGRLSLGKVD
jgi:leucyl aminopeptidase (aminopeptidase T)